MLPIKSLNTTKTCIIPDKSTEEDEENKPLTSFQETNSLEYDENYTLKFSNFMSIKQYVNITCFFFKQICIECSKKSSQIFKNNWKLFIIGFFISGCLIALSVAGTSPHFFSWIDENIEELREKSNSNKIISNTIFVLIHFLTTPFFPSKSIISIITAFILKDFWSSVWIMFFPTTLMTM